MLLYTATTLGLGTIQGGLYSRKCGITFTVIHFDSLSVFAIYIYYVYIYVCMICVAASMYIALVFPPLILHVLVCAV